MTILGKRERESPPTSHAAMEASHMSLQRGEAKWGGALQLQIPQVKRLCIQKPTIRNEYFSILQKPSQKSMTVLPESASSLLVFQCADSGTNVLT
jgi:hypothetical protein